MFSSREMAVIFPCWLVRSGDDLRRLAGIIPNQQSLTASSKLPTGLPTNVIVKGGRKDRAWFVTHLLGTSTAPILPPRRRHQLPPAACRECARRDGGVRVVRRVQLVAAAATVAAAAAAVTVAEAFERVRMSSAIRELGDQIVGLRPVASVLTIVGALARRHMRALAHDVRETPPIQTGLLEPAFSQAFPRKMFASNYAQRSISNDVNSPFTPLLEGTSSRPPHWPAAIGRELRNGAGAGLLASTWARGVPAPSLPYREPRPEAVGRF
ncbi:Protein of unknown function [Gryllus bimaculatus]|nr:Protein of unknown function [Gryllus bimaculatus]